MSSMHNSDSGFSHYPPSLGLRGMWALIANSSAVVVQTVFLFILIFSLNTMHREAMLLMESVVTQERLSHQHTIQRLERVVEDNTRAMQHLAGEIRQTKRPNE
jgi:hypothetical protein